MFDKLIHYACASDQRSVTVPATSPVPAVLNTLIANTSGPFGNVPRPPSVVLVKALILSKASVALSPGWAMKEKIVFNTAKDCDCPIS